VRKASQSRSRTPKHPKKKKRVASKPDAKRKREPSSSQDQGEDCALGTVHLVGTEQEPRQSLFRGEKEGRCLDKPCLNTHRPQSPAERSCPPANRIEKTFNFKVMEGGKPDTGESRIQQLWPSRSYRNRRGHGAHRFGREDKPKIVWRLTIEKSTQKDFPEQRGGRGYVRPAS